MFAFWLVFILVGVVVMPAWLIVVALALFAGFVRGNSGESALRSADHRRHARSSKPRG
jgi:hypothetical protein